MPFLYGLHSTALIQRTQFNSTRNPLAPANGVNVWLGGGDLNGTSDGLSTESLFDSNVDLCFLRCAPGTCFMHQTECILTESVLLKGVSVGFVLA